MNDTVKQKPPPRTEEIAGYQFSEPALPAHKRRRKYLLRLGLLFVLILTSSTILYFVSNLEGRPGSKGPHSSSINVTLPRQPHLQRPGAGCINLPTTDTQQVHNDDLAMKKEHLALLALVPVEHATHIAGYSGNWSEAATWCKGTIPDKNADVVIPAGSTITYDLTQSAIFHTIRVDGILQFSTGKTTAMTVDTIVVSPAGSLIMGSETSPMPRNITTTITFADNGPINTQWDPLQLSRGLISHGQVQIYGATKTPFLSLAQAPVAGATTITLSQAPENWQVGDKLVLTGTQPVRTDEARTIEAISGTTITLNEPLRYNHMPPAANLAVYVANYTRNIVFKSANPDDPTRHGHIMFMHSDKVNIQYTELDALGRTDKSRWADDPGIIRKGTDHTTEGQGLNPRGRYALHFHLTGTNKDDSPATAIGNAIYGSPGWGFVNHQSNVIMKDNAAYNVLGAAFVGEDGNEIGEMIHNIAIGSDGSGKYPYRQYRVGGPHTDPLLLDMWHRGHGFAFRGQGIKVEDNVCANQAGDCYAWDGWDAPDIFMPRENLLQPAITNDAPQIKFQGVPILDFRRNVAFATPVGIHIDGIVSSPTDARNVLEDVTIWNVGSGNTDNWGQFYGIQVRYSSHITIRNGRIIDSYNRTANPHHTHTGISVGPNTDMVIDSVDINGFAEAIDNLAGQETGDTQWKVPTTVLDSTLTNNDKKYATTDPTFLREGSKSGMDLNKLDFVLDPGQRMYAWPGMPGPTITGTIIDSLGQRTTVFDGSSNKDAPGYAQQFSTSNDTIKDILRNGYYMHGDGTTYILVDYAIHNRITGDAKVVRVEITFKLDDWRSQGPIGPNLGTYQGETKK